MAFSHLDVANGLSQNSVMDVLQDRDGYVWIATENGLNRFDGHNVQRYQRSREAADALADDFIWQLDEGRDGDLWLATRGGGLAHWHRTARSFSHFRHDPFDDTSLSSDELRSVLVEDGVVWAGDADGVLNRLDIASGEVRRIDTGRDSDTRRVYAILRERAGGRLLVGTDDGVASVDGKSGRLTWLSDGVTLSSPHVRVLMQSDNGDLWIGTIDGGINVVPADGERARVFRHSPEVHNSLPSDNVRALLEDDQGRIWVGTTEGLALYDGAGGFTTYRASGKRTALGDNYIMSLFQDRGGVLWVGTRTAGVHRWNSRSWSFGHFRADWLDDTSVTSFATEPDGYWTGTFGNGLVHIDPDGTTERLTSQGPEGLPDDHVMALLRSRDGTLWVGTMRGGLAARAPGASRFETWQHDASDAGSIGPHGVMSLFEDSAGHIWVGTFRGGAARLDRSTNRFTRYEPDSKPAGICGTQARAFAEDGEGHLWIATDAGLCLFREPQGFVAYTLDESQADSIADNSIYALYFDAAGRLWIGTAGGGLDLMLGSSRSPGAIRFKNYSRAQGLASNMVYAIVPDDDGMLWLSGNNGLTRFDPESGTSRTYRSADGLQGEEFHYGAQHRGEDGRLYFGGANGYNVFDPNDVGSNVPAPPLVFTNIEKASVPIATGLISSGLKQLDVAYGERSVTFEFAALDYTDPANNHYRWRLDGFDAGWTTPSARRRATYTNLDAGDYRFLVQGANSEGVWNRTGLQVDVVVAPPPWASREAWIIYFLSAIGIAVILVRAQRRKALEERARRAELEAEVRKRTVELEASNLELQRVSAAKGEFLARMSHEIRSPMNGVLGMTELLVRSGLDARQGKIANTIRRSGELLLHVINDVLDFSRIEAGKVSLDPTPVDIEEQVDDLVELFAVEAGRKQLVLMAELPPEGLPVVTIDGLRLRQVLVNLVANALKFTERGLVKVIIEDRGRFGDRIQLDVAVVDTGIGISPENRARIFESFSQEDGSTTRRFGGSGLGLSISSQLVRLLGGRLEVESVPGQGSRFRFDLDLPIVSERPELPRSRDGSTAVLMLGEPTVEQQFETYLEQWGVDVTVCNPGQPESAVVAALMSADFAYVDETLAAERLGVRGAVDFRIESRPDQTVIVLPYGRSATRLTRGQPLEIPLSRRRLWDVTFGAAPNDADEQVRESQLGLEGRVLLVEDNPINQEVFTGMLAEFGCTVRLASDGASGLDYAECESFDVILMDYHLPDMDGTEVARRIRALPGDVAETPIVALSAATSEADRERFRDAGMNDYLGKPCTMEELVATLGNYLKPVVSTAPVVSVAADMDEAALAHIAKLKRADGSSMLSYATQLFSVSADESLTSLRHAIAARDSEAMRFVAHRFKSSCAHLGARGMASACSQLEELGKAGSLAGAETLMMQLTTEHPAVMAWLAEHVCE